jgi:hypothetical protein
MSASLFARVVPSLQINCHSCSCHVPAFPYLSASIVVSVAMFILPDRLNQNFLSLLLPCHDLAAMMLKLLFSLSTDLSPYLLNSAVCNQFGNWHALLVD